MSVAEATRLSFFFYWRFEASNVISRNCDTVESFVERLRYYENNSGDVEAALKGYLYTALRKVTFRNASYPNSKSACMLFRMHVAVKCIILKRDIPRSDSRSTRRSKTSPSENHGIPKGRFVDSGEFGNPRGFDLASRSHLDHESFVDHNRDYIRGMAQTRFPF